MIAIESIEELVMVSGGAGAATTKAPAGITCTISKNPSCTGSLDAWAEAAFDTFNALQNAGSRIGSGLYDMFH